MTFLLLIPALILAIWAQYKVKSTYAKFSQIGTRSGLTGAEVARYILRDSSRETGYLESSGANASPSACTIEAVAGHLTDHYDPRDRTLRLSEGVYNGRSIAALGIAAHEVGHAIQHAHKFAPLMLRNTLYPVSAFGSKFAFFLFIGGLLARIPMLLDVAIVLYCFAVAFTLITLPVELDASRRALRALAGGGYLQEDEMAGARKVLTAAAMTYVASVAMAVSQLLRMLILRGRD